MRSILMAVVIPVIASWFGAASAMAQEWTAAAAPVDFRACKYREGKDFQDLEKVNATFRTYANEHNYDYAAWTLHPQYQTDLDFDLGWLGAWPDGESFGVSMENWMSEGLSVQAAYDEVIDCSGRHEMALSLPINAPESTPEDGLLMFYACNLKDGKTVADAYKAHLDAGTVMKGLGSLAVSWFFEPVAGASVERPDYYHVLGFYRYSDLGATMDLYVKGGRAAQQKILSKVSSCATPVIFDALSVRAHDER